MEYSLRDLSKGKHGFHLHEAMADGYGETCLAAKGHYNPEGSVHGGPRSVHRHVGDLGNVVGNGAGEARGSKRLRGVKDMDELVGRSVVLHERVDDLGRGRKTRRAESARTGNAGLRLACGTLRVERRD